MDVAEEDDEDEFEGGDDDDDPADDVDGCGRFLGLLVGGGPEVGWASALGLFFGSGSAILLNVPPQVS